eukprot:gene5381-7460_t
MSAKQQDKRIISCIASIDQGTSSSRVLIVSTEGIPTILSSHQIEISQYYPKPGYVEHDPVEIYQSVLICLANALHKIQDQNIKIISIGITNQRETTVIWNKTTGIPYHKAIVWNDTRTSLICDELSSIYGKNAFQQITGLPISSYFSASKIICLLNEMNEIRSDCKQNEVMFGTIDTWLIWNLTNHLKHVTDVTNASRTMLMNLTSLQWDDEILRELNIPINILPKINTSSSKTGYGSVDFSTLSIPSIKSELVEYLKDLIHGVPITGVLGDQQAALFGQTCFEIGSAKCTYGTGAFLLKNIGPTPIISKNGLLTTVAYQIENNEPVYALEGSVAYCGSLLQWCRDNMELISSFNETEKYALSVESNNGLYFIPAFSGLFAPYWRNDACGIIVGLSAFHTKAHIIRAAIEAAAFQVTDVLHAMQSDYNNHIKSQNNEDYHNYSPPLKVDGGMTVNNFAMQFQSDILNVPLVSPKIVETTALGAAYISGLGVGLWKNIDELKGLWIKNKIWNPSMKNDQRSDLVIKNK